MTKDNPMTRDQLERGWSALNKYRFLPAIDPKAKRGYGTAEDRERRRKLLGDQCVGEMHVMSDGSFAQVLSDAGHVARDGEIDLYVRLGGMLGSHDAAGDFNKALYGFDYSPRGW